MRGSSGEPAEPRAGDSGNRIYAEYKEGGQPWKKFVYVEPPRRVKEVLEEELYFRRDEGRIKHPSEVALEGIWSLKRNFPVGGFKTASQTPSSVFPQPKYYSRHAVIRTRDSGPEVARTALFKERTHRGVKMTQTNDRELPLVPGGKQLENLPPGLKLKAAFWEKVFKASEPPTPQPKDRL